MHIMQGDSCPIAFRLAGTDGESVTISDVEKVEVVLGSGDSDKRIWTYDSSTVDNRVTYDSERDIWVVVLTQEETFGLRVVPATRYTLQIRVKFLDGTVIGTEAGSVHVVGSKSKEVL